MEKLLLLRQIVQVLSMKEATIIARELFLIWRQKRGEVYRKVFISIVNALAKIKS